ERGLECSCRPPHPFSKSCALPASGRGALRLDRASTCPPAAHNRGVCARQCRAIFQAYAPPLPACRREASRPPLHWDDAAFIRRLLSAIARPCSHELPAFVENVAALVGGFGLVA